MGSVATHDIRRIEYKAFKERMEKTQAPNSLDEGEEFFPWPGMGEQGKDFAPVWQVLFAWGTLLPKSAEGCLESLLRELDGERVRQKWISVKGEITSSPIFLLLKKINKKLAKFYK